MELSATRGFFYHVYNISKDDENKYELLSYEITKFSTF